MQWENSKTKERVGRKMLTTKSGRTVTVNVKMPIKGLSTQPARKLPKFKPKDKDEPKNNKSNRNQFLKPHCQNINDLQQDKDNKRL